MSTKYFIYKTEKEGPFTRRELKKMNLDDSYSVWFKEIDRWENITNIPELDDTYIVTPPDFSEVKIKENKKIIDPAYKFIEETNKDINPINSSDPAFKYISKEKPKLSHNSARLRKKRSIGAWILAFIIALIVVIIKKDSIQYSNNDIILYKIGSWFGFFLAPFLLVRLLLFVFRPIKK